MRRFDDRPVFTAGAFRAFEIMRGNGALWLRLGVVEGNVRAERFWERSGYWDIRKRQRVEMGKRLNALHVMAKPLAAGSVAEYLALVARDRPESQ